MSASDLKHPSIQETTHELTAEQQSSLLSLREALGSKVEGYSDTTLIRFLTVNGYSAKTAETALLDYIAWREQKQLATILSKPPTNVDIITQLVPHSYHSYDVDGRPIYIEKTGAIHCSALADESILPYEDFINSHIWGIENLMNMAHQRSLETGKRVDSFTTIIDMEGVGFQHRVLLGYLKACMDIDNKYYPLRIGKLHIINTGWIAPYAYSFAYPLLPVDVQNRINVVNGNPSEFLRSVVPPENLPKQYGGNCTCDDKVKSRATGGGSDCVPIYDATDLIARVKAAEDGLDKQHVSYDFEKRLKCGEGGGTFSWYWVCEGGYDIDFTVSVIADSASPSAPPQYAHPTTRQVTHRGSFTVREPSTCVFKWDNSFSYFTGKDIRYAININQIVEKYKEQLEAKAL